MRVIVLVLDGVFDLGLASFCDALAVGNTLTPEKTRFNVSLVGVRRRVLTAHGLTVPITEGEPHSPDIVLVPALGAKTPSDLNRALSRGDVQDGMKLLRSWAARGSIVAAACTGTFVLGGAALLDGRRATTTWWLAQMFRERFPRVNLDESRTLVEDAGVVTAGAAVSHLDLALWVIRRVSPAVARETARYLAFDSRALQGVFSLPSQHVTYGDPLIERFERWAKAHLAGFSIETAARGVGSSPRTLERHLRRGLGKSPLGFVRDLRVSEAIHQLETTDRGTEEIAALVGYESGATLRTLLRERTGLGVAALRRRGN